jgi:CRISPR-associated endonuclease/helicase Cas3
MTEFYAHTKKGPDGSLCDQNEWEPLFTMECETLRGGHCPECENLEPKHGHLNKVAYLCSKFTAEMFPEGSEDSKLAAEWGRLAGLWHDLGKFSEAFQERLRGKCKRANHSTAGAQLSEMKLRPIGHLISYVIAGHHTGLADFQKNNSAADLWNRLQEQDYLTPLNSNSKSASKLRIIQSVKLPDIIPIDCSKQSISFFTRQLFSCLVDADFLATEAFMDCKRFIVRPDWPVNLFAQMESALVKRYKEFDASSNDPILMARFEVHRQCLQAANKTPGLITLTVPTGGGKTLASLAFALAHAQKHRLRRIIYVIPFTSIIEQTADEFRCVFGRLSKQLGYDLILEHHSNFDPKDEHTLQENSVYRLLSENWDAPLVVTTNIQFFESLAHHKTSHARKLHNLARSIVILDEAQSLPPEYLEPSLDFLKQLTTTYNSTAVLCTATQPAIGKIRDQIGSFARTFNKIALDLPEDKSREIISKRSRII